MTRMLGRAPLGALLLVAAGAAGCDSPRLKACDIGTEECQIDVYYALVRMRGDGLDPFVGIPPIRTLSRDEYRAQLEAQAERSRQQRADRGEPEIDPTDVVLQLLGMVTRSQAPAQTAVDTEVGGTAAFYSSGDQTVTVIERPPDADHLSDTQLLLHELVHAFQARDVGLVIDPKTADEGFTRTALVEGEATHYQYLGVREMNEEDPDTFDWDAFYLDWQRSWRGGAARSGSPYFAVRRLVYPLGGYMTTGRWVSGGNGAIRSLQASWPRAALAYMLGPDVAAPGGLGLSCQAPEQPGEMKLRARNQLGALQLYALLLGQGVEETRAWEQALGWRGDAFTVYFDETTEAVAGSWGIRLESEAAAAEVLQQLVETETLRATRRGADVVVDVGSDAAVLAAFEGIADCG